MTGAGLVTSVRFSLHDRERDSDTGSLFIASGTITRSLTDALATLLRDLIEEFPRRAHLTVAPLVKTVAATVGGNPGPVPDDFWILECGTKNGKYVAPVPSDQLLPDVNLHTYKKIGVVAQTIGGEADTMVYFALPPTIANTGLTLPYWPDGVYNCAKYLACANIMVQEERHAMHSIQFFVNEYNMAKDTLRHCDYGVE